MIASGSPPFIVFGLEAHLREPNAGDWDGSSLTVPVVFSSCFLFNRTNEISMITQSLTSFAIPSCLQYEVTRLVTGDFD